jgi:hypothetical protein
MWLKFVFVVVALLPATSAIAQQVAYCTLQELSTPSTYPSAFVPFGINDYGTVVGYIRDFQTYHGFIRYNDGTWKIYDFPGSSATILQARNGAGTTVGEYNNQRGSHGLVLRAGSAVSVDIPGAGYLWDMRLTSINKYGTIIGSTYDFDGTVLKSFKIVDGKFQFINFPGTNFTGAQAISDTGEIVGYYEAGAGIIRGFTLANGTFHSFQYPGASSTRFLGVNRFKTIVGNALDTGGNRHPFMYKEGSFFELRTGTSIIGIVLGIDNTGRIIVADGNGAYIARCS